MAQWKTKLIVQASDGTMETNAISIKKGIFQGDSLSPLLFCIALIPLTSMLRTMKIGYKLRNDRRLVNHLLFMDDLKLFANNENNINILIEKVKTLAMI